MVFKVEQSASTRFRDIAGMKEPKKEITEIVDFLRNPQRYTALGAKIPTGALLLGPPGTGKTLLAKAVSGESQVAFIPVCGADFVELYVGMGALRVRQLFQTAHKQRCIIYIDEIDAIGLKRGGKGDGESQEQERTLNELLTQLDGFSTGKRGEVLVIASSNVDQAQLDPALVRPGRFDRIIHVDAPVLTERMDIFKVHLCKLKLMADPEVDKPKADSKPRKKGMRTRLQKAQREEEGEEQEEEKVEAPVAQPKANTEEMGLVLSDLEAQKQRDADQLHADREAVALDLQSLLMAKTDAERVLIEQYARRMSDLCPGFVGADIANVCNEAAILAAREDAGFVTIHHLERSIDRVLAGIEQRSRVLSDFEKHVVAHHEAGHAVAGWFLNRADPLMKVSIVPRGGSALGYAQYLPNENHTRTARELRDAMKVSLGGRVAEQIFFQHLSTGASDDLRKVGAMAYQYVSSFGANGGAVYPAPGTRSTRLVKPFGERKSNHFDAEVKALVDEVYAETLALLTSHKEDMKRLADHLLQHEILTFQDVVSYLGSRTSRESDRRKGV
ncbi:ATP-dependent zinc metallopeptidase [Strigomonas culicis]|uniref:ATP-dependent zinc metallopeptidase n=1 Tax=Strigomonas culicis TaxID=28005 RepID=S9TQH2_9TRYP|nr:ATP-dependent zinc metallopeptidase [Strigomonas culicis]|eukprot:EPY18894.1 ATP-dependent zinc metallopeptidase [Strigomonas culicis]